MELLPSLSVLVSFLVLSLGDVNIYQPQEDEYKVSKGATTLVLQCMSDGVGMVWVKDGVVLESSGSISIVLILDQSVGYSTLRIDGINSNSSGRYSCRNPEMASDEDVVTVTVPAPDRQIKPIQIVGTSDKKLEVFEGETFTITCDADIATQVQWSHDDITLGDAREDIAISFVSNENLMTKTSTLQKDNASQSDAGTYKCMDRSSVTNKDTITVYVKPKPKFSVEIAHPDDEKLTITVGKKLQIRCLADPERHLVWKRNGAPVQANANGFLISNAVDQNGKTISQITKATVTMDDAGSYTCSNKRYPDDNDMIKVIVKDLSDVKTETIPVLLRVGETLKLRCTLPSATGTIVTWYKDGQSIDSSDAYIVTGNELQIKNSKKSDARVYECHFQQPNSSEVIGIIKHNVTTKLCPLPVAPSNGGFDNCPTRPVYGETCSFKCDDGFTLEGSAKRSCNLDSATRETTWSGKEPECAVESTATPSMDIPVTTSEQVLRVGTKQKLNCKMNSPVKYKTMWSKDDEPITENTENYRKNGHTLSFMAKGIQNVGIYKCVLISDRDGNELGIKIFNVTAKSCSPLRPPANGIVQNCADTPLYGSICTYKCNPGFTIVGETQRLCEFKPKGRYIWTGKRPQCKEDKKESEEITVVSKEEKRHPADVKEAEIRSTSNSLTAHVWCIAFVYMIANVINRLLS